MATQDSLTPFGAGVQKASVQRIKAVGNRQWRHEVAPDKANQSFDLALVIAFSRPAKAIVEQVVTLQFCEHV